MIIGNQTTDIIKEGFSGSKKATINPEEVAKLQYILTKGLYSDGESAVIVEWSNNAIDSVIQAGKDIAVNPVIVELTESYFRVSDTGLGLTLDEFENVVMNYLTSTKSNSNETIGHFGLGSKSFVALDRPATFTLRKNGVESKVLAYMGAEFLEYDLIYTKDTDCQNGVIAEIMINSYSEFSRFRDKCKSKLAYYDGVILKVHDSIINNQIIRSDDWQYSEHQGHVMKLCLKDVVYDIEWDKLGLSSIYMPIALRFNLDSGLTPTPSRQSLIWNQFTIDLVKEKIKKVANWFSNKFNENWKEHNSIVEIWNEIDVDIHKVHLGGTSFDFNDLIKHSNISTTPLKVKDIELQSLKHYKSKQWELLSEYKVIVDYTRQKWAVKHCRNINISNVIIGKDILIHVNSIPTGKFKEHLLNKHKGRILFIKKIKERELGKNAVYLKDLSEIDYIQLLNLTIKPENQWQPLIDEWNRVENEFKAFIIDETETHTSKEYLDWVEEQKKAAKANKFYTPKNHKVLNKQDDEVTIAICRETGRAKGVTFEKKTFKVNDLHKRNVLTIYFDEEYKEKAKEYYNLLSTRFDIAIIGKREKLKIQDKHNFMTKEQFEKSKPFKRIATSILFDDLINSYEKIIDRNDSKEIIKNCVVEIEDDIQKLREYKSKNGRRVNDGLLDVMLDVAKENNLYDYELMDVYNRAKMNIDKYSFLQYMVIPNRWNEETTKEVESIINQMLYHKRTYRGEQIN